MSRKPKSLTKRLASRASSLFTKATPVKEEPTKTPTVTPSTSAQSQHRESSERTEIVSPSFSIVQESTKESASLVSQNWASFLLTREPPLTDEIHQSHSRRKISVTDKNFLGKGRDALCYWLPVTHNDTVVVKIPRYAVPDLPVPYISYLSRDCGVSEKMVRSWVECNFRHECDLIGYVWRVVAETYMSRAGLPGHQLIPPAMLLPPTFEIQDTVLDTEDKEPKQVTGTIVTDHCLILPRAICDAYYPFRFHFGEQLLISFCEDILFQMQLLEQLGVAHGDLKLLNILLVRQGEGYLFLLADFWDSFYTESDGKVCFTDENSPMRTLFRWKCQSEKFGTRMYKDPCLLDRLRQSRRNISSLRVPDPGAVNMWSFGVVLLTLLLPSKHSTRIKGQLRKIVSEKKEAKHIIRNIREEIHPFINDSNMKPGMRTTLGFDMYLWGSKRCPPFVEKVKAVVFKNILVEEQKRASASELVRLLGLNLSVPSKRIYNEDLASRCRSDHCVFCDHKKRNSFFG
ncbi:MAG: hypothetical protein KVP17_003426 [Porospora cf. gigantea B]|uniref:uncharacterized protein n=1 Tax=Porospora cf. gigantea B TaxID=2853592 RepID=UPI003571C759|nr:MAG: hypothetical protein KVP17_003426 [Porospora cf. gigantea B]